MKKLLFVVLLICSCMYSSAQSDITKLKQTINAEKRNVQQLFNKRDNLITSYQIVAKDYIIANAKKDSLSQKPNSPAYKNAIKKADKLLNQRNQLLASIEQMKQDIDSINLIIADNELKLQQLESQKAESKKDKNSKKSELEHNKREKNADKPSNKNEKTIEQDSDVEVDKTRVRQDKEIFIDNERETIVEEPNEVGDTPLDLPEDYICERADNSNEIESSPIGFKALLLKIWKFIKILFWIIIGIIVLVLLLKIIGSTSTSSSSYSSNSQTDKDAKRRQIANLQRDIAYLQDDLQRARADYARDKSRTNKNYIASYKIQIAQKRAQIASIRASMH